MNNIDINEFKECINELQQAFEEMVVQDSSYEGEAEELMGSIKRLKIAFKDADSINDLDSEELEKIMPDFALVMKSLEIISGIDEEEELEFDEESEVELN